MATSLSELRVYIKRDKKAVLWYRVDVIEIIFKSMAPLQHDLFILLSAHVSCAIGSSISSTSTVFSSSCILLSSSSCLVPSISSLSSAVAVAL